MNYVYRYTIFKQLFINGFSFTKHTATLHLKVSPPLLHLTSDIHHYTSTFHRYISYSSTNTTLHFYTFYLSSPQSTLHYSTLSPTEKVHTLPSSVRLYPWLHVSLLWSEITSVDPHTRKFFPLNMTLSRSL